MTRTEDVKKAERHNVLRAMLEERRKEIKDKLHSILETLPEQTALVQDAEEQSVSDFVREVDFTLMQMKSETLAQIDGALSRLEEGTYGRCLECEREIPEPRLRALPFAFRCRDCQERHETAQLSESRSEAPALGTRLRDGLALTPREARHD
jgi:DnaK suppressor protein